MAKKKTDEEPAEGTSFADSIYKEVSRQFGEVIRGGDAVMSETRTVIPVSPVVDQCLGGGVPEGTWVTCSGKYGTGKTTTGLKLAANAQKPEYGGRSVYYLSVEGRYSKKNATGTRGLNTAPPYFNVIESTEDHILSCEDFLRIASLILNDHPGCVLIIDSPSAFATEGSRAEGVDYKNRGQSNKLFSEFIRQNLQVVRVRKSIVWCPVHLTKNQGPFGGWDEKVAEEMNYAADVKLRIKYDQAWKDGPKGKETQIGQFMHWECDKSPLCGPGRTGKGYLRYGVGLDDDYEMLEMACELGAVEKKGAWINFQFLDPPQKIQGMEGAWNLLQADQSLKEKLRDKVGELTCSA